MKRYYLVFKNLLSIANKKFWVIVGMFVSCCFYNISSLLPPIATSGIIAMITNANFNGIWFFVILYILFYIMYYASLYFNYYTYTSLAEYYHIEVQKKLLEHISNNDIIYEKISKGKIIETCSDDIRYLVDVIDCAVKAATGILKLVIIYIIFMYYDIFIGLFVLLLNVFYLTLMNNNSSKISKFYEGTRKYEDKVTDILNQMLSNLKQIKTLNLMPKLDNNMNKVFKKWKEQYKGKRVNMAKRYSVIPFIIYLAKILLYIYMAFLVIHGKMTLDKLVLLISYYEMTVTCMDTMLDNLLNLDNYGVRVNRIKNILECSLNKEIDFGELENDYINGVVEFKSVWYGTKGKNILNKVSFKALPNEITTIVGHSGSGKTTIINLLYRLIRLNSGEILIDNESVYNYSKKVYSSNVTGIFQKPFVFEMSIKENLSLIDSNTNNQIEACKRVGIHDFIMSLPKGYNTIITEDDLVFTDGKKQLLIIARALLTKAEILLFDEVTSNIDPSSTVEIGKLLVDLKTDHTIIMITHKPQMMEIADKIIVLDKGKVVAKGQNDEVYKKSELYRDLKNRTFASISINDI